MKTNRRSWLKLGALAALSPLARSVALQAQGETDGVIPKRFIALNMPHGWANDTFTIDAGASGASRLGECLSPLEAFADRLLLLKNLNFPHTGAAGDTHQLGHVMQLSAELPSTDESYVTHAGGISIDRAIGQGTRGANPFAAYAFAADYGVNISADGLGQDVRGEFNQGQAFRDLFAGISGPVVDPAEAQERLRRRRVVDFARGEYATVARRLGSASRRRIELHEQALSDLASRLEGFEPRVVCEPPAEWSGNHWNLKVSETYPLIIDNLVAALACGVTNVASISCTGNPVPGDYISGIENPTLGHHLLSHSHEGPTSADQESWRRDSIRSQQWFAEQVASLLRRLSEVPEVDGSTMLDHTVILMTTEVAGINDHSQENMRFLLAGNVDGYFRTGRELDCGGAPHSDLFSSLMHAYGLGDDPFGSFGGGLLGGVS